LKQFYTLLFAVFCSYIVTGQSEKLPNSFTYKVLGVDTYSPYLEELYRFDKQTFAFSAEYSRYIGNSMSLSFPFRLGTMEYPYAVNSFYRNFNFYAQDVALKYGFAQRGDKKVQPYISIGLGALYLANAEKTWNSQYPINQKWEAQIPIELGINYQIMNGIFLQLSTAYRFSTGAEAWHNGIGIQFQFNTKKEGEITSFNESSSLRGIGESNHYTNINSDFLLTLLDDHHLSMAETEDSDHDGVPNSIDLCPDAAGDGNFGGCPLLDDDNDGLANHEDRCPDVAGDIAFAGCPDSDGDRIADIFDLCPNEAGTRSCKGCPDMDNDNVPDALDKCPTEAGQVDNEGCPMAAANEELVFKGIIQPILFENEQHYLDRTAIENLDNIILLMNRYPNSVLSILGIAYDNDDAVFNEQLSDKRAKSCFQYLTKRGVSESRITYQGLGNSRSVNSLNLQRSVEFHLFMN
jgi:outer membrane protein OmpA-like peptidoglycan-associated protein